MKQILSGEAFAVTRISNFRYFLACRFFMTMATLMQSVVVGWHLYSLTKNVLSLGLIGLTEVIPQVSIALFAGHYIDIWDRRKIIKNTSFLLLFGSALLSIYCVPSLNLFKLAGTLPIFVTIFLTGLSRGILMPANVAFIGHLVPRELYANAATWNSTNWHVAAVLGPALGGLIYGFIGIEAAYITVFTFYLISFLLILKIKTQKVEVVINTEESIFSRIHDGIKYVFKNQVLLGAFSLDMFAVLFGGAVALLPVFASDILKTGPQGLGLLRASPAIGAIIMSLILMFNPPVKRTGSYLFGGVAGFGLCIIGFALSTNFYLSAMFLFLSGMFDNISVVIRGTILQLYTPDAMRGRVAAVNSIFIGSSNEFGAFESGVAAKLLGTIPSVIFGGTMTLIVVAITAKSAPLLRKLSLKKSIN
jgi:MFS family permease